jgi:hypothetical protein
MSDLNEKRPELKIYVVGETSGNPEDWSEFGSRKIVIAESPEQALDLSDATRRGCVCLLNASFPMVVMSEEFTGTT